MLAFILLTSLPAFAEGRGTTPLSAGQKRVDDDVAYLCALVPQKYAYYASRKDSWVAACALAHKQVRGVTNGQEALSVFESLIDALYDPHASLGTNTAQSPRLIPSGSDVWLEEKGDNIIVAAVRKNGGADTAGIQVGDIVTAINGQQTQEALCRHIHTSCETAPSEQRQWALNAAAAGYRHEARSLDILRDGKRKTVTLGDPVPNLSLPPVTAHMLNDQIGYIRINNSLGNDVTVAAFDKALERLRGARACILDLRDTPGGGNTSVAEPILGRFIETRQPYQRILPLDKPAYNRQVSPRGPWTAKGALVVLVGRWTGSMGEGMAIGLDAMGRGTVIGSHMAGLAGGTDGFTLPATSIPVHFPTYDLAHLNGTARHNWLPPISVVADEGSGADRALERAMAELGAN
ncbi:MAG: S41 family peptidase [Robiginitomaculum sp.]|nr:S41 family peptidase [Robiginitomaculum sp.]MDQ7076887.1 S41 family peptidase [Robiginitomaculum sp.]